MKKLLLLLSAAFLFVACENITLKEYMKEDGWNYLCNVKATTFDESASLPVFYKEVGHTIEYVVVYDGNLNIGIHGRPNDRMSRSAFSDVSSYHIVFESNYIDDKYYNAYVDIGKGYYFNLDI